MSTYDKSTAKNTILMVRKKLKPYLNEEAESLFDDLLKEFDKEEDFDKSFDPIAGSGGDANYSRFYANNLENSVPTFSEGPYTAYEDDNYFRGMPNFTNNYNIG